MRDTHLGPRRFERRPWVQGGRWLFPPGKERVLSYATPVAISFLGPEWTGPV